MQDQHGGKPKRPTSVTVTLAAKPRTVRVEGLGAIKISKQVDRHGRLQIVLRGLTVDGFGLTDSRQDC